MIELPMKNYDQLRNSCDPSSPAFTLLTNGCIEARTRNGHNLPTVQIICEKEQAVKFVDLATNPCPDAITNELSVRVEEPTVS